MSSRPLAIDAQGIEVDFGGGAGIFDQSYQVPSGTILGMIGPSGCGKTTTVRVALGLLVPHKGRIQTLGRTPAQFRAVDREQIGYIPQQFVLYPRLSVWENAEFVASLYGMRGDAIRARLEELLQFADLADARDRLGANLSGGMQRRLMLVGALMHNPALLFADEPTAGIDPVLRARFWDYFRQLRDQGRTLVVTTQVVSEAIYCDYVAVMRKGRILAVARPAELRRQVLGGEVVHITLQRYEQRRLAAGLLRQFEPVKAVQELADAPADLHVTVDDAREWLPELLNLLEQHEGRPIPVGRAAPLEVSYDEIFIRLMEQDEEQASAQPSQEVSRG